ncbi:MAG TPA: FlgD immunoglobulin-like domain containing protein, partial [Candidatus Bathyarchaeia archaeon]|nr:FlgD immunoglobulin-like domain containing protein [Candidatus Bathyarchaeia archaeon]
RFFYNDYLEILPGVEAPTTGTFKLKVDFPAYLSQEPLLSIDGIAQDGIHFTVPDQRDSLRWEAVFPRTFTSGLHVLTLRTGDFSRDFTFNVTGSGLVVDSFSFPNPFRKETNIVYSLNLAVENVTIDIYNVSGILIRQLVLPPDKLNAASLARPHSVLWDGRDLAGDRVANGTYIYVLHVRRAGETVDIKGKSVKLE